VFISTLHDEGSRQPATGSGATSAASTLRWGTVSGWTTTGSQWCNATPPIICTLAGIPQLGTSDPPNHSAFYDLDTWSFHGTGFTSQPVIHFYRTSGFGNSLFRYAGSRAPQALVPALSLLGISGAAIALAAAAAARKRSPFH
jgi:hypothetical protein